MFWLSVGKWILSNWKQVAVIVAALTLFLYVDHLRHEVKDLKLEIELQKKDLATCESNNKKLQGAIDEQNKSFKKLEDDTKVNEKKLTDAEVKAGKVQAAYNILVQKILTDPAPKGCEASTEYLKNAAKELSQSWSSKRDKK